MTDNTGAFVEDHSDFYDQEYFLGLEYRYLSGAFRSRVTNILACIGSVEGKRILDVDCGGGFCVNELAKRQRMFLASPMLRPKSFPQKGRQPELDVRVGSAYDLPSLFEAASFDVVTLYWT